MARAGIMLRRATTVLQLGMYVRDLLSPYITMSCQHYSSSTNMLTVLLGRTKRQQHGNLVRRLPHRSRHLPGSGGTQLLAEANRQPTHPHPRQLLRQPANPYPPNRQPHLHKPGPTKAQRTLHPTHQRALPRRNQHPHLRPPPQ